MALTINIANKTYNGIRVLEQQFQLLTINVISQKRYRYLPTPRLRNPTWFTRKIRSPIDDSLSIENKEFLKEVVQDKIIDSNLNAQSKELLTTAVPWTEKIQRTGLIAKKIGIYPLWLKTGKKVMTTLLQVVDNHVVKYHPPETYNIIKQLRPKVYNKKGVLLIGAQIADPSNFTKEYCGLFKESGVVPTQWLGRFFVSPEGVLPLGTTLTAKHFQVGNYVDVRGKTIDRGFQGVMKRHGFKGMPASHGVTKTHRRPGNIGGGGEKARVWPGTKLPGHMGNRYRVARGLKILRINYKYNVMWVIGQAIPGETNSMVYVFDTKLPLRQPQNPLPVPTLFANEDNELPEEVYDETVHSFKDTTILFEAEKQ